MNYKWNIKFACWEMDIFQTYYPFRSREQIFPCYLKAKNLSVIIAFPENRRLIV